MDAYAILRRLAIVAALLLPQGAWAQCNGVFPSNTVCGNGTGVPALPGPISIGSAVSGPGTSVVGDIATWNNTTGSLLADTPPLQIFGTEAANKVMAGPTTGSAAFPTFRSLVGADLPNPSATTLGGINSYAAVSHQWINAISTSGVPSSTEPDTSDLTTSINALVKGNGSSLAAYTGTSCTNQATTALSALGVATCASITNAFLTAGTFSSITGVGTLTAGATGSGFTIALGLSTITGQLGIANGGTNAATQQAALNNIAPSPTRAGDIIYYNGTNWVNLAGNNSGTQYLQETSSGVPSWASVSGSGTVTSVATGNGLSGGPITTSGTLTANVDGSTITDSGGPLVVASTTIAGQTCTPGGTCGLTKMTNSIGSDINLTSASYTTGPTIAQGTTGTWLATGAVTINDNTNEGQRCKLWDGTTVIDSSEAVTNSTQGVVTIALSGYLTSPAGNINIACSPTTSTSGVTMKANQTGAGKDSTLSVVRID